MGPESLSLKVLACFRGSMLEAKALDRTMGIQAGGTFRRRRAKKNNAAQKKQDSFLNTARKERSNITIYLVSGVKLTGRIRSFDKYSVVLETNNQEQLIFKHAISTVVMGRVPHAPFAAHGEGKPTAVASVPTPVPPPPASGTEG